METLIRFLNIALVLMFASFAYLQLNDPRGAAGWLLTYSLLGLVVVTAVTGKASRRMAAVAIFSCAAGIAFATPVLYEALQSGYRVTDPMSPEQPYVEVVRETGGLFLGLLAMIFVYWQAGRSRPRQVSRGDAEHSA